MKGCSSCGGGGTKKPSTPSGRNAANPFTPKKSSSIKSSSTFSGPRIKTSFKIGK